MFDDHPATAKGQVPGNLPTGDLPEDIFGQSDAASIPPPAPVGASPAVPPSLEQPAPPLHPVAPPAPPAPPAPSAQPSVSAMDAGVLRPKAAEQPVPPLPPPAPVGPAPVGAPLPIDNTVPPPVAPAPSMKTPGLGRGVAITIVVVVVLTIVGGGGWWIYSSFINTDDEAEDFGTPTVTDETADPNDTAADVQIPPADDESDEENSIADDQTENELLFGEPIDTDGDQLEDDTERAIGTDPNKRDSDGDELEDGDEVLVWNTDPLNPDTDGDSYLDGLEVKAGYSPSGPGKLFELPSSTPSADEVTE